MRKSPFMMLLLAIFGTVIDLLPLAFMLITSLTGSLEGESFLMDYLIPVEMGYLILGGGLVLLFCAWKSPKDRRLILYGLMGVVISFGLMALMAWVSGADQTADPSFWQMASIIIPLVLYDLASIEIGVCGILYVIKIWPKKLA